MNNEAMFRVFFDNAPDAIFTIEKDGTIIEVNKRAIQLFGFKKSELVGETINKLVVDEIGDWYTKYKEIETHKNEGSDAFNSEAKKEDSTTFYAQITINSIKTGGEVILLVSIRDITKTQELHNQLEISNQQFKGAFKYSAIGMGLVSTEGKWLDVNKSICDILGYTKEELLVKTFQEITHPDDLDLDLEHVGQMLRGEIESYQMEKRYYHKNGSIVWVLLAVSLSKDVNDKPLHFVSQIKDITEQKSREKELLQSIDLISRQNSRLMNFAHIVSHNLRSHTGNFQLLVNMLSNGDEDSDYIIGLLQENSKTLSETIEHLNEVVQIQTNQNIRKEKIRLSDYINKTIEILSGDINLYNVTVTNAVSSDVFLDYNIAYLESILLNFLSNAIKYKHHEREPEVEFSVEGEGESLMLAIKDNGLGINLKKHSNKLFKLYKTFHRNDDARGVGLFITKNQVDVMGGRIEVESIIDSGTTFKVYFNQPENQAKVYNH